jgi:hypothetical protein
MDIIHMILAWVSDILIMTAAYIFILMGPGLILAVLLHYIHKILESNAQPLLGRTLYLYFFGGLGTAIHEAGHALMCFPFGHKITEIELFNPNPNTGTLGFVNHSYNPKNIWALIGNFFISIGPIILGSIVIYFSAYFLISKGFFGSFDNLNISFLHFTSLNTFKSLIIESKNAYLEFSSLLFTIENLQNWKFWLFIYILITVGGNMTLSPADIKGASKGFFSIIGVFIFIGILTKVFRGNINNDWLLTITEKYSVVYAIMLLSVLINLSLTIPLILIRIIVRK